MFRVVHNPAVPLFDTEKVIDLMRYAVKFCEEFPPHQGLIVNPLVKDGVLSIQLGVNSEIDDRSIPKAVTDFASINYKHFTRLTLVS